MRPGQPVFNVVCAYGLWPYRRKALRMANQPRRTLEVPHDNQDVANFALIVMLCPRCKSETRFKKLIDG